MINKLFSMVKQTADTQIFLNRIFQVGKVYAIDLGISGKNVVEEDLPRFTFEKYCSEPINTEDEGYERLWFKSCVSGIRCIIDPTDIATAKSVDIYSVEEEANGETIYMEKLVWVKVCELPFDTSFFKVGHPYLIRCCNRCHDYYAAILVSITPSEMKFISVDVAASKELVPGEYVEKVYTHTVEDYKKHKKEVWYKALLPTDVWSDAPNAIPIVSVRKYIKDRRKTASELNREILDEIDGVIVSSFNAAYGGVIDDDLYIDIGGFKDDNS